MESPLQRPEILAPAGDKSSFLAALAGGADAVYCGLKHFSARMAAENFSLSELTGLANLARSKGCKTYVAFNTLLKPQDILPAGRLIDRLNRHVRPDALIVQDLGLIDLARQSGFPGEIHLSTLANVSFGQALPVLGKQLPVQRVVLPRELSIDEIKAVAENCPPDMGLEVFVHGALCYGVSGRCYWSSYLGGKSGLRGRCVQPCRRIYSGQRGKGSKGRFFSCLDLGLDVLARTLLDVPRIMAWKIEGRKKSPHYVYYTTTAYRLLRDNPKDPESKKAAQDLLQHSLGRATTNYFFLPQRPQLPMQPDEQTGSGLFVATTRCLKGRCSIKPRIELLPGDLLRVGYQDLPGHFLHKVRAYLPKGRSLALGKAGNLSDKTPVFLIDREEQELRQKLRELARQLQPVPESKTEASRFTVTLPRPLPPAGSAKAMDVYRHAPTGKTQAHLGLWLAPDAVKRYGRPMIASTWWWLPPVIWPQEEMQWRRMVGEIRRKGARFFVCNAPWQAALFDDPDRCTLWAGPFCNQANALSLGLLQELGFSGAVVSPELSGGDVLSLPAASPLPLGVVVSGSWPLCVARSLAQQVRSDTPLTSPKGEVLWTRRYGANVWVYPDWPLDLRGKIPQLKEAGYALLVHLHEPRPKILGPPKRTSTFNWDLKLL